jgi:hypothetical protein
MSLKKYANDYETIVAKDEEGNEKKITVYRGPYFEIRPDQTDIFNFKRSALLLLGIIISLHFSSGFINNPGMYQFYVALPYVFAYLALLYLAQSVLRLPKEKRKFRRDEIELSFERMKTSNFVLITLLGLGILGEIVFSLFFSAGNQRILDYLYLTLEGLAAVGVYFIIKLQRKIYIQPSSEKANHTSGATQNDPQDI